MAEIEKDFLLIPRDSNEDSRVERKRKPEPFYVQGKYKILASLYNLVHTYPNKLPSFTDSPIYMMSNCFSSGAEFLEHFGSLLWFTYRKDFPPLWSSHLTTDIGWGCMIRTEVRIFTIELTNWIDWQVTEQQQMSPCSTYRKILRWFYDSPSPKCPYSLHNFMYKYSSMQSTETAKIGEWFTPTRVCHLMKELVKAHNPDSLTMYISTDGVIYKDDVTALCTETQLYDTNQPEIENSTWKPLMIVVPVRLGVDRINRVYIDGIRLMLRMPQSVGIIGGRPRESLYFVGYQDDELFYLDPHIVKSSVNPEECGPESYHCSIPRKMPIENIDPSLAIGFFCATKREFESFCKTIDKISNALGNPIFTVADSRPIYVSDNDSKQPKLVVI